MELTSAIPIEQLRKLDFLLGEFSGRETLYPPEAEAIQFDAFLTGSWERCERFIKIHFYANIPTIGIESFDCMLTFDTSIEQYRMWVFATSQPDPVDLSGPMSDDELSLVSSPTRMAWGMQRLRFTLTRSQTGIRLLGERFEPSGFVRYCEAIFERIEITALVFDQ